MALIECSECGKEISSKAEACPHCGNPTNSQSDKVEEGTFCSSCRTHVTPVVTSVGGGSCSVGKRETWKCPKCKKILHKSGCFVATVTYGDENIVEVRFLRAFRDQVLSKTLQGRMLIWIYYHLGSHVAYVVELFQPLKTFARLALDIIIKQIESKTCLKRGSFRNPKP